MKNQFFHAVTGLGDAAVVLPLSVLLLCTLWSSKSRKAAWLLLRALLTCLFAMTALKLLFLACGYGKVLGIVSPSGHASIATFFYGAVAVIAFTWRDRVLRYAVPVLAVVVIVAVAISRVALGFHSVQEVLCGMMVGVLCLAWFAQPYLQFQQSEIRPSSLFLMMAPALLLTYGLVLPVEPRLRSLAPYFRIAVCDI